MKFPVPQQPDFSQGNNKGPKENAEMSLQSSELEITGFGLDKVQLVPSENTKSIRGKINLDDKDMIDYQVIIPFDVLKSAVEVNKSFSVLINWGEFKKPENGAPSGDRPPRPDMNGDQKPPMGDRPGPGSGPGDGKGPKMQELDIMVRDIIILKK